MESAIARRQTPEEQDLDKKLAEVAALQAELALTRVGVGNGSGRVALF